MIIRGTRRGLRQRGLRLAWDPPLWRNTLLLRAKWGTDQAASVEVIGLHRLVRNIRDIEKAMGAGVKKIYPSEMSSRKKLRRASAAHADSCC